MVKNGTSPYLYAKKLQCIFNSSSVCFRINYAFFPIIFKKTKLQGFARLGPEFEAKTDLHVCSRWGEGIFT